MDLDTILGIAMIVLGALVLLGEFAVGWLLPVLGVVLIVMGALMLLGVLAGGFLTGIAVLVMGILLYVDRIGVPDEIYAWFSTIVGVVLIILGLMQAT